MTAAEYAARHQGERSPVSVGITRTDLAGLFADFGLTKIVEIGVEQGEYSEVLCRANPGIDLLCVDAWKAYRAYREHVTQAKLDGFYEATKARLAPYRATLVRKFSVDAARDVADGSLDAVYIDANHRLEQVIADLAAWVPKVRPGGIVSGHDMRRVKGSAPFHVVEAVHAWTRAYKIAPWFILRGDTSPSFMWVQRG